MLLIYQIRYKWVGFSNEQRKPTRTKCLHRTYERIHKGHVTDIRDRPVVAVVIKNIRDPRLLTMADVL